MSSPATREQLKNWCLRQLGHPVLQINVDDDQVEDRIDEAFQYYREFNSDGIERTYLKHQLTQTNIDNQYIPISDSIIGVTKIFPLSGSNSSRNMFDMRYQMRLHDLYDFTSTSYVGYAIQQQHLRTIDMLFAGEVPIRFNRHTNKLFIDWDWAQRATVGDWIIVEGYIIIDPDTYSDVYNDRMLKKLATAYIKKQWGTNMKKFGGMQLPGGVVMNGQQVYDEAMVEIKDTEDNIRNAFESPPGFLVG
jgi:hypothetical protein